MRERSGLRIRVLADGAVEIVDPDPETLPLLQSLDPGYRVATAPLPGFMRPRLLVTRATMASDGVSALDVKIEHARRALRSCRLCAHACAVDRTRGERGKCGLGTSASVYEAYIHIAEEPPINPALNISLRGCGLRCRSCQQFEALKPVGPCGDELTTDLWSQLDLMGARSLVFVGGNPTESLPAVLEFLRAAPADFSLPIGWNTHGYDSVEAIRLLDGVVDVYIPDVKYGSDACAERLSGAPGYVSNALSVVEEMCRQGVPVFIRVLVLPGHNQCCHLSTLDHLGPFRDRIQLNVMGQYAPDFVIAVADGPLARRPRQDEVEEVRHAASAAGFSFA
jgi:putative pyruvate formate lyase activating enzyme